MYNPKSLLTAVMLVLIGLNYLFNIVPIPQYYKKLYLDETESIYVGATLLTMGLLTLFHQLYKWQKEKRNNK
jgi:hypothetical protein